MKVILADDVVGLGDIGENVTVKPGYARNFLLPRGLAVEAGAVNARILAHKIRQIDSKKKVLKVAAEAQAEKLRNVSLELGLRVGGAGKVFGSIGSRDIAEQLKRHDFVIDRRRVILPEPIKKIGAHFVSIKLHPEVRVQIKLNVKATKATKKEEAEAAREAQVALETASSKKKAVSSSSASTPAAAAGEEGDMSAEQQGASASMEQAEHVTEEQAQSVGTAADESEGGTEASES